MECRLSLSQRYFRYKFSVRGGAREAMILSALERRRSRLELSGREKAGTRALHALGSFAAFLNSLQIAG